MANEAQPRVLAPTIRSLLGGLRRRIRMYVWLEGIALAIVWLGLTFWSGLALDYMPVLLGASEMPVVARTVLLVLIAIVLGVILYRWVLRRAFVRMADHSMAVLLERHFEQFHDSLVTAVEMSEQPDHATDFNPDMLDRTREEALVGTGRVRLGDVFNFKPLAWKMVAAIALIVPIGVFYVVNAQALEIWVSRIYLLQDRPWPRNAQIEVVGIDLLPTLTMQDSNATPIFMKFNDERKLKVARGASLLLRVRANAGKPVIPDKCSVRYRTTDGNRGRVDMVKVGTPKSNYQLYTFDGKPFQQILSTVTFDVVGYDHRVRDYQVTVVELPTITGAVVDCIYPRYTEREPRPNIDLVTNRGLTVGSKVTLRCETNKPLTKVELLDLDTKTTVEIPVTGEGKERNGFQYEIESLPGNVTLDVTLHDLDGVVTQKPHRIFIAGKADEAPKVTVRLRGIGTAVTPDVVLPAEGTVEDLYGVHETWFDVLVDDAQPERVLFGLDRGGVVNSRVDFREQRGMEKGIKLQEGNKLIVSVKASDKYDLGDGPNIGTSDAYQLEVVSSDELLSILERRELGLRQRFEQIIEEVTMMRDSLVRVQNDLNGDGSDKGAEPGDEKKDASEPGDKDPKQDPAKAAARARSLRLLRIQRAQLQSEKSAQETLGVGTSFDDIRLELINNRVDSEDRKTRLQEQIAEPLKQIAETMFPELDRRLNALEEKVDDKQLAPQRASDAVEQAEDILVDMDQVLQKMLELESYNELVDFIREMLAEQRKLIDATEAERKKQALELLK